MEIKPVAWVKVVAEEQAQGDLARAYASVADSDGRVENLYKAMSLTPLVIKPADNHYRALLHDPASPLEPWLAELIATHVSILCGSRYAETNHAENFAHYFGDRDRSSEILAALRGGHPEQTGLEQPAQTALCFAHKLTLRPENVSREDIVALRVAGFEDTEISYIAQIASSFAYWARITIALGIAQDETIGLTKALWTENGPEP